MRSREKAVTDYIETHREDIVRFLCDFIGYQSIHPVDDEYGKELEAQKWLKERMERIQKRRSLSRSLTGRSIRMPCAN